MPHFDLISEKWLPVVLPDNRTAEVSLRDALINAHTYQELRDESPLVTVSLLRLILALLYRCFPLSGEGFLRCWQAMWKSGSFPVDAIEAYLSLLHERGCFDLFDTANPFYQVGDMSMREQSSVARLIIESASGNNATLFDHTSDSVPPSLTPQMAVRHLIATQAFAVGFGVASTATIKETEDKRPNLSDAIMLRGAANWLSGDNLFQTLMLNFFPLKPQKNDKPAWELEHFYDLRDRKAQDTVTPIAIRKGKAKAEGRDIYSSLGMLDRYTWQSRMVLLLPDSDNGETVIRHVFFTHGRDADKNDLDPMVAYSRKSENDPYVAIKLNVLKATWRDAHSLLAFDVDVVRRPLAFNHVAAMASRVHLPMQINLHTVGLAASEGKAAKLVRWRHDRMAIPIALLQSEELVAHLELNISEAERVGRRMLWIKPIKKKLKGGGRVFEVCKAYLYPDQGGQGSESDKKARVDEDRIAQLALSLDPRPQYWSRLETYFTDFLLELSRNSEQAQKQWSKVIKREAKAAYQQALAPLGNSARALRAISKYPDWF